MWFWEEKTRPVMNRVKLPGALQFGGSLRNQKIKFQKENELTRIIIRLRKFNAFISWPIYCLDDIA